MSANATTVTVTSEADKLIDDNTKTSVFNDGVVAYCLFNTSTTVTVYVGGDDVTPGAGFPIPPSSTLTLDVPIKTEVWALTATGTAVVRVLKVA
jgi:hypothetical protein